VGLDRVGCMCDELIEREGRELGDADNTST
jgi:hypothetical protein